jgi:dihydroorotase
MTLKAASTSPVQRHQVGLVARSVRHVAPGSGCPQMEVHLGPERGLRRGRPVRYHPQLRTTETWKNGSTFDVVVRGGDVIDPVSGRLGRHDIAINGGRIVDVARAIPSHVASVDLDAEGALVVPGLVDMHTHVFSPGTYWGIDPRPIAWRSGVTSWIDAGSAGTYNFTDLRQLCGSFSNLRTRAFINISAIGLIAETGEARRDDLCNAALAATTIKNNRDFIVGVKCRVDRFAVGELGLVPLKRAIEAARSAELPVMVHIGTGPPEVDDVLDLLRAGDIVTHCYTGRSMALMDDMGRPRPSAVRAKERGVLLDIGHGSGGFSFAVAESMLASGLAPDIISSDLHQHSVLGPCFDLPTCMSKFLALGMPLEEVVKAVTVNPARALRGTLPEPSLAIGAPADLAIFELRAGDFALYDTSLAPRKVGHLLVNRATIAGGVLLLPEPATRPEPWIAVTEQQAALLGRSADELRLPWAISLTDPSAFIRLPTVGPPT